MNRFTFYGRFASDPEIRYSGGENATAVASFNMAVNRRFKRDNQPDADFFRITAFGKTAEVVNDYFHKGSRVVVSGRIQNNNYTKDTGEKVYGFEFLAEEIDFVDTRAESRNASSGSGSDKSSAKSSDDFINVPEGSEDELPFN